MPRMPKITVTWQVGSYYLTVWSLLVSLLKNYWLFMQWNGAHDLGRVSLCFDVSSSWLGIIPNHKMEFLKESTWEEKNLLTNYIISHLEIKMKRYQFRGFVFFFCYRFLIFRMLFIFCMAYIFLSFWYKQIGLVLVCCKTFQF